MTGLGAGWHGLIWCELGLWLQHSSGGDKGRVGDPEVITWLKDLLGNDFAAVVY